MPITEYTGYGLSSATAPDSFMLEEKGYGV